MVKIFLKPQHDCVIFKSVLKIVICVIKGLNCVYFSFQSYYQWLSYIWVIMCVIKELNCVYFSFQSNYQWLSCICLIAVIGFIRDLTVFTYYGCSRYICVLMRCIIRGLNCVYFSFQSYYQWLSYICVIAVIGFIISFATGPGMLNVLK